MIFRDREDAGRRLAEQLKEYANSEDMLVLGIPRGGVTVAFEIARELRAPLDVFLSQKLGVPGHEELAFGAVAAGNGLFLDQGVIQAAAVSPEAIEHITRAMREKLNAREVLYRGTRPPLQVDGRTVILVDDGVATGSSIYAAICALRRLGPKKLAVAVPVAPNSTRGWLRTAADELVCLYCPKDFFAVGEFYGSFPQVSDEEVVALLRRSQGSAHG